MNYSKYNYRKPFDTNEILDTPFIAKKGYDLFFMCDVPTRNANKRKGETQSVPINLNV